MIKIVRFLKGHKAVLGKLYINDEFFCYTLEKEWLDNEKYISCIPPGKYSCKPYSSKKYPDVTQVTNVENRDKILIHAGNYHWDVKGCILLGSSFKEKVTVKKGDTAAVYSSRKTLKEFFAKVGRDFELEILSKIKIFSVFIDRQNQSNVFIEDQQLPKIIEIKSTNLSTKIKNKMPIITTGIISLVKIFAPSIINRFKRAGKNLAENTAKKLIEKAEKKLGFKITNEESANKARDQLDSKDLVELEKLALKTDAQMFADELKYGEDLTKSWKDEFVTVLTFTFFGAIVIMGYSDHQGAEDMVKVIKALLLTPFGALFIFVGVSAIGGKHLMIKLVDKFIK